MAVVAGDRGEPPKPNVAKSIDHPKPNGTRTIEPPPQPQRTSTVDSIGSIGSSEGTSEQLKVASAISLIDFSADPEPTASAPPPRPAPTPQKQRVNASSPQPILEQGKMLHQ